MTPSPPTTPSAAAPNPAVTSSSPTSLSRMERWGLRYLQNLPVAAVEGGDALVHVLNDAERRELSRITRGAIARAFLAGALSGLACALASLHAGHAASSVPVAPTAASLARYWAQVGAVTVLASVAEIAFLSWDALRSVRRLAAAAGLQLQITDDDGASMTLGAALVRAALEMPNPPDLLVGLNPLREASRWRIAVAGLVYKLKVAVTGMLVKLLVRRALGRAATRAVLELLAVPVTAVWDALVCAWILREARLRVVGPSAAEEFLRIVVPDPEALDVGAREVCLRAVASSVVRTQDLHPNLLGLMLAVQRHLGFARDAFRALDVDDTKRFLAQLHTLPEAQRALSLRLLSIATIIDGRLAGPEKTLLREAFAQCGREPDFGALEAVRRDLTAGRAVAPERVRALA